MPKPKLTKKEEAALMTVRDMLDRGLIEHKKLPDNLPYDPRSFFSLTLKRFFNMGTGASPKECGTVACIGGWTGAMMGMTIDEAGDFVSKYEHRGKFKDLFFPSRDLKYEKITPKHAVKAIDSFLETGKPNWPKRI